MSKGIENGICSYKLKRNFLKAWVVMWQEISFTFSKGKSWNFWFKIVTLMEHQRLWWGICVLTLRSCHKETGLHEVKLLLGIENTFGGTGALLCAVATEWLVTMLWHEYLKNEPITNNKYKCVAFTKQKKIYWKSFLNVGL